jgi:hypothetical protein
MAEQIIDGTGTGKRAKVDNNNQLHVFAVTESEQRQATAEGNEYNLNTGEIALTGTGESSLIYFKNDESEDFVVTSIALGIGTRSATVTDFAKITVIKNPIGGDIISDAILVDINSNTNFGSSKELASTSLVYKGKNGGTITGGSDHAILYSGDGRLFANINIELPKGSSIGIKIDLNTSGGANVYCTLIGYVADDKNNRAE